MDVERLEPGHRLEIYVSPTCPYCAQARAYFDAREYAYSAYDAQNDADRRREMLAFTNGDPTVPAFVVDGAYAGSGWGTPPRG
ncbi:MAG TPA: glutaredoxin [Candidatus Elarobacter sp.]|jgi:glutaredoxin 3